MKDCSSEIHCEAGVYSDKHYLAVGTLIKMWLSLGWETLLVTDFPGEQFASIGIWDSYGITCPIIPKNSFSSLSFHCLYKSCIIFQNKEFTFKGHGGSVDQLCWHAKNPELLCTASGDKTVRVWDTRTQKCPATVHTKGKLSNSSHQLENQNILNAHINENN